MAEETSRARSTLPDTSWDAVQATTERSLLLGHLDWLVNGAQDASFKNALFDHVAGLPKLVNAFKSFVTAKVADMMVERLLTFKLNASLRHNKPVEMIAHHIDKLLCKGQNYSSDEVFNEQLDAALGLYRFTTDKDVFRT
ncbi:hypothetical protein BGW80DRAFT_1295223, partial [Lactifluus volemus]